MATARALISIGDDGVLNRQAEPGLGVILGTLVCGDGQSNWYKGVQLITIYAMALMCFRIPELVR